MRTFLTAPREPVNAWTHWAGAAAGAALFWPLLAWARARGLPLWPFAVFGVSLTALYAASASYHTFRSGPRGAVWLRKLDHAGIFLLIAGTYTPVLALGLHGPRRVALLTLIWTLAALGTGLKLFTLNTPRVLSTALYVGMGWLALAFVPELARNLPGAALLWLAVGGAFYTLGALIYALKRPARPRWVRGGGWTFHEIWHLFVLAGSAAHALMMFKLA
ncbi:hemolysin III family protein [Deinococcus taklimakanensis]|uniref:Hemolysin III family protein n=1 Tax=Deinococcus taklimakanensis TaxID=536443 RepID=A0ABW5P6X4_9DEIO